MGDNIVKEKINFILENYSRFTLKELAAELKESPRWIKRRISNLHAQNKLSYKEKPPEKIISEKDWSDDIKFRAKELRQNFLKTNDQICNLLKKEFNFNINPPAFQFWAKKLNIKALSKKEWLSIYFSKEIVNNLLENNYSIKKISHYIKDNYDLYFSEDLILHHIKNLGLLSPRLKEIEEIKKKSMTFSKDWIYQKINEHTGLRGLSEEMGFSKTVVMKRIKEENLKLIKHRKLWSSNLESLRDQLLSLAYVEVPEKYLNQMILGWLIGDGHLDFNGRLVITHSIKQLDYLYVKVKVLKKYITNIITSTGGDSELVNYLGGSNQIGISCPGLSFYCKYLNKDGSKNYDKIYSDLEDIGWACYFMDDGSYFMGTKVMTINHKISDNFINKYIFGEKLAKGLLEVKKINPYYIIPSFLNKIKESKLSLCNFWDSFLPELFKIDIKNDLDLSLIKKSHIIEDDSILNKIYDYYQNRGFPYYKITNDYLKKEFENLKILEPKYFWKGDIFRFVKMGYPIIKHFMTNIIKAEYGGGTSPLLYFNDKNLFNSTISFCLEKNKSILPDFVYDNIIKLNGRVSIFPCAFSKALIEKFCPENGIVIDPCVGWGGRLLGAASLNRTYIGYEPWVETYKNLIELKNFYNLDNVHIKNEKFIESSIKCNLVFTSPPYIDLEVYEEKIGFEGWKNLIKNIFYYAENNLVSGGHLILNIPRNLKQLLPKTILEELKPLYWHTMTRRKTKDAAEIVYIWKK